MPANARVSLQLAPLWQCVVFFGMPNDMPHDAFSYTLWRVTIVVGVLRHNA